MNDFRYGIGLLAAGLAALAAGLAALAIGLAAPALAQTGAAPADPESVLILETEHGDVTIRLRPDVTPRHAERLATLARQGFYDGVPFHRVIDGFMAQTGDPTGTGMGGSDLPDLRAEFSDLPFLRGTVGMARSADPHSANSQFFITFERAPWLDRQYTLVGEVVDGMEAVDAVKRGDPAQNGMVTDPDRILRMRVAADQ